MNTEEGIRRTMKIKEEKVKELIKTISKGLVSGVGEPEPGQMCVMHAISVVMEGEQYSDRPICVHDIITDFDIVLNDCYWSSDKARAKGMIREAVAKLGSTKIDGKKWARDVFLQIADLVIPKFIENELKPYKPNSRSIYKYFEIPDTADVFIEQLMGQLDNIDLEKSKDFILEVIGIAGAYDLYEIQEFFEYLEGGLIGMGGDYLVNFFTNYYPVNDKSLKMLSDIATDVCIKHKTEGSKFLYLLD